MNRTPVMKRRPAQILEVDETISVLILKQKEPHLIVLDEPSKKKYKINRSPIKRGLQMTGA
ncbi:MAG: hypothetical protein ABSG75_14585 [Syntrophales bacterium]|jgi:hypothetical protein